MQEQGYAAVIRSQQLVMWPPTLCMHCDDQIARHDPVVWWAAEEVLQELTCSRLCAAGFRVARIVGLQLRDCNVHTPIYGDYGK